MTLDNALKLRLTKLSDASIIHLMKTQGSATVSHDLSCQHLADVSLNLTCHTTCDACEKFKANQDKKNMKTSWNSWEAQNSATLNCGLLSGHNKT